VITNREKKTKERNRNEKEKDKQTIFKEESQKVLDGH
jgi:hypothetical protein